MYSKQAVRNAYHAANKGQGVTVEELIQACEIQMVRSSVEEVLELWIASDYAGWTKEGRIMLAW